MKNVPENELFSAYLDGELTADEQARMDQLLGASAAARQLLEEFRTLSATLQALPTRRLGEDLAPRVLRLAERRMLTEPRGPLDGPVPSVWQAVREAVLRPRNLVWAGLAAAIALMLYATDTQGPQGPGRNPAGEPPRATARQEGAQRQTPAGKQPERGPRTVPSIGPVPGAAPERHVAAGQEKPAGPVAPALRESIAITDDSPTVKSVEIVCQVNPKLNGRQRFAQVLARRGLLPPELAGGPDSWQFATEELRAPGENPAAGPKSHAAFAVELEATRAEIERVIADLRARPEEFISVTVPPEFAAPTKATAGQSPVDLFRARFVVRPAAAAAAHGAPSHP